MRKRPGVEARACSGHAYVKIIDGNIREHLRKCQRAAALESSTNALKERMDIFWRRRSRKQAASGEHGIPEKRGSGRRQSGCRKEPPRDVAGPTILGFFERTHSTDWRPGFVGVPLWGHLGNLV